MYWSGGLIKGPTLKAKTEGYPITNCSALGSRILLMPQVHISGTTYKNKSMHNVQNAKIKYSTQIATIV
jgi:hypothetical protein